MCGIFGCITSNNVEKTLIQGLEHVEYRGYDSSGICVVKDSTYNITKAVGEIKYLKNSIKSDTIGGMGIAHTRWATTGKVCIENTHPFVSENGKIALVHNGIIENVDTIKHTLSVKNYTSDTDSEMIAHMLQDTKHDSLEYIDILERLDGSYAIAYTHLNAPNTIYVAKNKCPLYIAKGTDGMYVASDPICFSEYAKEYYILSDHEYGILTKDVITIYDKDKNVVDRAPTILTIDTNYTLDTTINTTHMKSEIYEIPYIIDRLHKSSYNIECMHKIKDIIDTNAITNVHLVGCGTAYHSCMLGAIYLERYANICSDAYISSEYVYTKTKVDSHTLHIFISQSGETLDTISCIDMVKHHGAPIVCITNATHSTIAHKSDIVLYSDSGKEYAVASTKTYVAQVTILHMLAEYLSKDSYSPHIETMIDIDALDHSDTLIPLLTKYKKIFILGRDRDYCTALEASLKIRETCYIPTYALSSGELKHGTLALVDKDTLCIVINTTSTLIDKNISTINEIQSRDGDVVVVSNTILQHTIKDIVYHIDILDTLNPDTVSIIPFQILANDLSLYLQLNPDKPRNLAKSVTVQ